MIGQLGILAVAVICLAPSSTAKTVVYADEGIVKAQKTIFDLLVSRFDTDKIETEVYQKGRDYNLETAMADFEPEYQAVVGNFLAHYNTGMLARGRIFSLHTARTKPETVALFNLFYYSPDIWTLVYLIIWSSIHLNEVQFYYVLMAALYQRPDTQFTHIPPSYHNFPEFFFNSDFMKQVYDFKMSLNKIGDKLEDGYNHVIVANYTRWETADSLNDESKLTYFTEDVNQNAFYEKYQWRYPSWICSEEYPHLPVGMFGEIYYWGLRIYLNRYLVERLSNDLGEIEYLNWGRPIITGYRPSAIYPNGMLFAERKEMSSVPVRYSEDLQNLMEFESRIGQVADSGYMWTKDGKYESIHGRDAINTIANLIQGNCESKNKNYYGSVDNLSRMVLGFGSEVHPSALGLPVTTLRDPGFFRIINKIHSHFVRFQKHLGPYTPEELAFDGVTLKSVDIVGNELFTYFEQVDTLIDRYWYSNGKKMAKITARQNRLNHEPFTFKLNVNSDKDVKASIRIFFGPKYDVNGNEFVDNWKNFFEFDYFTFELKKGENIFERKSVENPWYAPDYEVPETFQPVVGFVEKMVLMQQRFGMPIRLLLPKGKPEGMLFQFFVYVNEYVVEEDKKMELLLGPRDNKTLGFPLDRPFFDFTMPNMKLFDIEIFHKERAQIDLSHN